MATESILRLRLGPYNSTTKHHTVYHYESDADMILVDSSDLSPEVKEYLQTQTTPIPVPENVAEVLKRLSPVAFGDSKAFDTTDLVNELKGYVNQRLDEWTAANHTTTGIKASAVFRGRVVNGSGDNVTYSYPALNTSTASSINLMIGDTFGAISDVKWESSDGSTKLSAMYLGTKNTYSDETKNNFIDLLQYGFETGMEPVIGTTSLQSTYCSLEALGNVPITASETVTGGSLYLIGIDNINKKYTKPTPLTVSFKKPMYYWSFVVPNDDYSGVADTNIDNYINKGTVTEETIDNNWLVNNGHSSLLITGALTSVSVTFTIRKGTKAYLYIAVPYSPYFNHETINGSKFFTGTNSIGTSIYRGYRLENKILDNGSNFKGGWHLINSNYIVTLPSGHRDRYCIYRTENAISATISSTDIKTKYTLSDFD